MTLRRVPGPARPVASGEAAPHADGSVRLSKRMSELGLASRREADEWIARGWVRVDGRVVNELGSRVLPSQHVTIEQGVEMGRRSIIELDVVKTAGTVADVTISGSCVPIMKGEIILQD